MSLTYQPFAHVPGLDRLGRDLSMNISDNERMVSGALGVGFTIAGLQCRSPVRWLLLMAGVALGRRAVVGHCPLYQHLDLDKRHGHSGVPGNRGKRVEAAVEIRCEPGQLFNFWRNLEALPTVMRNVKSVQLLGGNRSRWKVVGPVGKELQWDAEIINEEEGRLIAWQSLPGATVSNAGSVRFDLTDTGDTRVKVAFEFDPPAGELGVGVDWMLGSSPENDLKEDLNLFKKFAELELTTRSGT